jgi:hypothetical protein
MFIDPVKIPNMTRSTSNNSISPTSKVSSLSPGKILRVLPDNYTIRNEHDRIYNIPIRNDKINKQSMSRDTSSKSLIQVDPTIKEEMEKHKFVDRTPPHGGRIVHTKRVEDKRFTIKEDME